MYVDDCLEIKMDSNPKKETFKGFYSEENKLHIIRFILTFRKFKLHTLYHRRQLLSLKGLSE